MPFNPDPRIGDARDYARKWKQTRVIIIAINDKTGDIEMATYGENAKLCDRAKELGNVAYEAVMKYLGGK